MKVFFDTNVYVAEALLGQMAEKLLEATERASWRIFASPYILDELERVLTEKLGFSRRLAYLSRRRIIHRAKLSEPGTSHHAVPQDPADSPILRAAVAAGVDYLVTNDAHLLSLDPYEGLRIISMDVYYRLLHDQGYLGS
ncbi:MAG: putative toxin-antitoxin system toxin component, PIN family [Isosphaerales bacterium]